MSLCTPPEGKSVVVQSSRVESGTVIQQLEKTSASTRTRRSSAKGSQESRFVPLFFFSSIIALLQFGTSFVASQKLTLLEKIYIFVSLSTFQSYNTYVGKCVLCVFVFYYYLFIKLRGLKKKYLNRRFLS